MKIDSYYYHLTVTHRDDVVRQAHRLQLLRTVSEHNSKTRRAIYTLLLTLLQSLFR